MSKASDLKRRLDAIAALFSTTLIGRVAALSPVERATFEFWNARTRAYHRDNPGAVAYAQLLAGEGPPALPKNIGSALFGPTLTIPATATDHDAVEVYRRVAFGG